ncbi:MAG: lipid-A-disaccharide synthase-related protein [Candidatus Omnitrophica bacterium]|nr:lipid-A-disaccharide synthase-related protein [Candidatus Omnitrophota bacterium]MCM8809187.1 lipid-A-disaccharide synthase-related protein [Candidatus Omnitrophota bacterium]MCM8810623.1 lipid-A-disaccharide synthase-related protein [Candidatus Omnitrophota bacterium]
MKNFKILVVSNGYIEDMMACQIVKHLREIEPSIEFKALPIVGDGRSYILENIEVLGPCKNLPSEGLVHFSIKYLIKDIKSGLINCLIKQIGVIIKEGKKSDFIIAVGDIFLCALCGFFSRKKIIFAATAQSIYMSRIGKLNLWLIKHFSKIVFPRDQATTIFFKKYHIRAVYLGSLAMDCVEITGKNFNLLENKKVIGMFPGRRKDAFKKIEYLLEIIEEIIFQSKKQDYELPGFIISISPVFNLEQFNKIFNKFGWFFEKSKKEVQEQGIIGYLIKNTNKVIVSDKFGDVIHRSNLIISFSGVSNEQAIGLGKPVITFPVRDNLYPWKYFVKKQKKLLGGFVFTLPFCKKLITEKIFSLLHDPLIEEKVKKIGIERVGPKGAGKKIALYIKTQFLNSYS